MVFFMKLTRFLDVSIKDKIDSLLFNGSEYVGASVNEVVSVLGDIRANIKKDGDVDDSAINKLLSFSDDKDIFEIIKAIKDLKKIRNNNEAIKSAERKFFLRPMNTFNEKCLVFIFILYAMAFFEKISFDGINYSGYFRFYIELYMPLTILLVSVFSGKNRITEYIEWSLVGLFVRDRVRAGKIVNKMVLDYWIFRITPLSFVIISVSSYFLFMFSYDQLGFVDYILLLMYLLASLLSVLNKARNQRIQDVIASMVSENSAISRNFK